MKNILRIGKRFRVRHNILKALYHSSNKEADPQRPKIRVSDKELSELIKYPVLDIQTLHEELHDIDEINCKYDCKADKPSETHLMLITPGGRHAYVNKKYLKEGRKVYWEGIYDPLKIILPVLTVFLSGLALYLNSRNEKNYNEIKIQLEKHASVDDSIINQLKINQNIVNQHTIFHESSQNQ